MNAADGSIFRMCGGDGDQSILSLGWLARQVDEPWFSGRLPQWDNQAARLLLIEDSELRGSYVAITSRLVASLDEQIADNNLVSAIVHLITKPGPELECRAGIGMAVLEVIE